MSSSSQTPQHNSSAPSSQQPSSWGQLLLQYEAERTKKPEPVERLPSSRTVKIQRDSSYNPITGTFTNPSQEHLYEEQQKRQLRKNAEREARTKRRDFDIVTNTVKEVDGTSTKTLSQEPIHRTNRHVPPRRDTDIITHKPITKQDGFAYVGIIPGDEETGQRPHRHSSYKPTQRDYSIITNRYVDHHEEKTKADEDQTLRRAALSLSKQKRFDILTMKHLDPKTEAEETAQENARMQRAREKQERMKPISDRTRDQASYDIATNAVIDDNLYKTQERIVEAKNKTRLSHSKDTTERKKYSESVRLQDLGDQRSLNRVAYARYKTEQTRGYDIVTNTAARGYHSSPPRPPRVPPKESPYLKEMELSSTLSTNQG